MSDKRSERMNRAAHRLEEAMESLDQLRIEDISVNNVKEVKELRFDMYNWMSNFEEWADAAENEEE